MTKSNMYLLCKLSLRPANKKKKRVTFESLITSFQNPIVYLNVVVSFFKLLFHHDFDSPHFSVYKYTLN